MIKSGSSLDWKFKAERGVAVHADVISEGKVAVMGVESFSNLGFAVGMVEEE